MSRGSVDHDPRGPLTRIRPATPRDVPALVRMSRRFARESSYAKYLVDSPEHVTRLVELVLEVGLAFVAERRPRGCSGYAEMEPGVCACGLWLEAHAVIGMIGALVMPHAADGRIFADEVAWWVEPEDRGGTLGPRLLVALLEACSSKSVSMVKMVAPKGSDVGRFLERAGFEEVESTYLRVLTDGVGLKRIGEQRTNDAPRHGSGAD